MVGDIMMKKNIVKIALDILLAVVFVLLFNTRVLTGMSFHEIAGLSIGLAFLIHKALNWKWIKQVTRHIFGKNITAKARFGYVIDVLLLLSVAYILVSGLFISKVLFPDLMTGNNAFFKTTHTAVSYFSLLLIGIHVGLHWQWVMNMVRRLLHMEKQGRVFNYIAKGLAALVFAAGIYFGYTSNYITHVTSFAASFSQQAGAVHNEAFVPGDGAPENGNGNGFGKGEMKPGNDGSMPTHEGGGMAGKNSAQSGAAVTILTCGSIMSAFAVVTYYAERLVLWSKAKKKVAAQGPCLPEMNAPEETAGQDANATEDEHL